MQIPREEGNLTVTDSKEGLRFQSARFFLHEHEIGIICMLENIFFLQIYRIFVAFKKFAKKSSNFIQRKKAVKTRKCDNLFLHG